jgi:hypothetical protein
VTYSDKEIYGRPPASSSSGLVEYATAYVETLTEIRSAYQRQDHATLYALREAGKAV